MTFAEKVKEELIQARAMHDPLTSSHEAYAVIMEEVDEFWDEVKMRIQKTDRMLAELVQVAAMAQRAAEDLDLV